jgi:hypothetical protein
MFPSCASVQAEILLFFFSNSVSMRQLCLMTPHKWLCLFHEQYILLSKTFFVLWHTLLQQVPNIKHTIMLT